MPNKTNCILLMSVLAHLRVTVERIGHAVGRPAGVRNPRVAVKNVAEVDAVGLQLLQCLLHQRVHLSR
jgi:hypothetical protein